MSVDFSGSNLSGAKFINCNLKTCSFRNTKLHKVEMNGNLLESTDFKEADILDISFENNTYHSSVLTINDLEEMIKNSLFN